MKCVLHIGTEKTGTTSIQALLNTNRGALRSAGFLYTRNAGLTNNQQLPVAAFAPSRRDDYTRRNGLFTDQQLMAHQNEIVQALRVEIEGASGNVHTAIFSSEQMHSRLTSDEEVLRLRSILNSLGFQDFTVIVYLREQVESVSSLYSTAVLCGRTRPPPEPAKEEGYWHHICDHEATLRRYRRVFGERTVKPRLFCKDTLRDGSVLADFIEAAGVDLTLGELVLPERQNESLSAFGLEVLRRLNQQVPTWTEDGSHSPARYGISKAFPRYFSRGAKFTIPADLAREYRRAYREGNEWVRKEYFPERRELFPETSLERPNLTNWEEPELQQVIDLLGFLFERSESPRADELSGRQLLKLLIRKCMRRAERIIRP